MSRIKGKMPRDREKVKWRHGADRHRLAASVYVDPTPKVDVTADPGDIVVALFPIGGYKRRPCVWISATGDGALVVPLTTISRGERYDWLNDSGEAHTSYLFRQGGYRLVVPVAAPLVRSRVGRSMPPAWWALADRLGVER